MENSVKWALWALVIVVVVYILIQEARYQECVRAAMQNPYTTEWLARSTCK